MKFYSTNDKSHLVTLKEAVTRGLAPDNGLYMPERLSPMPNKFFEEFHSKSLVDISFAVAKHLLGEDIPHPDLKRMIMHTLSFETPMYPLEREVYAIELFHGPTLAFKDLGARFMSQLLTYFVSKENKELTILVATSGDTGSAVANGFLGAEGIRVVVLYPSGKVSEIQEKQFTTLGRNITALEVDGTFDDCQRMVKQAFMDTVLQERLSLTSANSINIARLIPQSFYFFYAWSRLVIPPSGLRVVFSVPSGNFGNLTAGLMAKKMGLPIHHFIAATNVNDVVPQYLASKKFTPRPSVATISNAMDVGSPSNFARMLDLYQHDWGQITEDITGYSFSDDETRAIMRSTFEKIGYVLDPHGAVGLLGLKKYLGDMKHMTGVFLETAHPAKFISVVEETLQTKLDLPDQLRIFMNEKKQSIKIRAEFGELRDYLLQ
jgi:threonine synthase